MEECLPLPNLKRLHNRMILRTNLRHPATNGQAERFVQTLKQTLRRTRCDSLNLELMLNQSLLQHRIMPHATTKKSPAKFLDRNLRTRLDLLIPSEQQENMVNSSDISTPSFTCGERVACRNYTKV